MLEREIREYIGKLIANNQEVSLSAIQEQFACDEKLIVQVLTGLNLLPGVDKSGEHQANFSQRHAKKESQAFVEKAPVLVDATIYQMQSTFSEMAHKLWENLAQASKNETQLIKQQAAAQIQQKQQQSQQLESKLVALEDKLKLTEQRTEQASQYALELEEALATSKQELQVLASENTQLSKALEFSQNSSEELEKLVAELQDKLRLAEDVAASVNKKYERSEKEKNFLTQEYKNTQIALIKAEGVINDLYLDQQVESSVLEKLGYYKHNKNMSAQSLTTKLFNNKK